MSDPKKPDPITHRKIASVFFRESVNFAHEEHNSLQVGKRVDIVQPARLQADGSPVAIKDNERADGLLLTKSMPGRDNKPPYVAQSFVPWASVKNVLYGE